MYNNKSGKRQKAELRCYSDVQNPETWQIISEIIHGVSAVAGVHAHA